MRTGFTMIGTYIACTAAGLVVYYLTAKKVKRDEIEMRSAQNVIFPLLIAERDREFLRQLRRNRDEEAELMKNVPGWEVRLILYPTGKETPNTKNVSLCLLPGGHLLRWARLQDTARGHTGHAHFQGVLRPHRLESIC